MHGTLTCRCVHCPFLPFTTTSPITQHGAGDILIFLTGREEIERCLEELTELLPTCAFCLLMCFLVLMKTLMFSRLPRGATQIIPLALHAGLSTEEQLRVFNVAERGTRKVIAATNIAEVSRAILVTSWRLMMQLGQRHHRWGEVCCRQWVRKGKFHYRLDRVLMGPRYGHTIQLLSLPHCLQFLFPKHLLYRGLAALGGHRQEFAIDYILNPLSPPFLRARRLRSPALI